ncbi:MAG: hypothetical protein K1X83_08620 [Oligoflexia bacterium]|nr:hypothetical protein [Oligoflexia bacterium]
MRTLAFVTRIALAVCGAVLCAAHLYADGSDLAFPRLGIYHGNNSAGRPLTNVDGSLNAEVLDRYAKYQLAIFGATPLTDLRKDIPAALRARNPNMKLFAYTMPNTTWCGNGYDEAAYFGHFWKTVRRYSGVDPPYTNCDMDGIGFLALQPGGSADPSTPNVNFAYRVSQNGSWRYPVAESIAELMYQDIYLSTYGDGRRVWDGIFFDVYCPTLDWMETGSTKFDYQRAGFGTDNSNPANRQAFLNAWKEGQVVFANRLRALIGDNNFALVGNCGQGELHQQLNGWMSENFPLQNGGTWLSNMYRPVGGYFWYDLLFRNPAYNFLFSAASDSFNGYAADNLRKVRFGLGSAALGEGFGVFGDSSGQILTYPYYNWWYDEYAVDRSTGESSSSGMHTGWLGGPQSARKQHVWANDSSLVGDGRFEGTTGNWQFRVFSPAQAALTFDQLAPEGSRSAHVAVTAAAPYSWAISLASAAVPISAYTYYSITFWAKTTGAPGLEVSLGSDGGPTLGSIYLPVTSNWKQYQVSFYTNASLANGRVYFSLSKQVGDFWFDNARLQQGVSSVYRRDFDYGSVFVNPEYVPLTFDLERPFRKIRGIRDAAINDGSSVTTVTIGAQDALFLLNQQQTDGIAPVGPRILKAE